MRAVSRLILIMLCFICQAVSHILIAQSANLQKGIVLNSATSEPVPFAEIRLKNNQLNVYVNAEGDFNIIQNSEFHSDSLIITCIGYKKHSIAFKDLNENEVNKIYLTASQHGPEKIKVTAPDRKLNSVAIIRRAIGNLNTRYPIKPFNYISYYRDYQRKDSNYVNLNEAIIQTYDSGFASGSGSNIYKLFILRKNMDFPRVNITPANRVPDSMDLNIRDKLIPEAVTRDQYGNKLSTLMAHDPIRNFSTGSFSFIKSFSENFIDNHNFSPPSEAYNDNLVLYKITFNGKSGIIGDSIMVSGAIYIQPKDYSIHKLEYYCYKNTKVKGLKKVFNFDVEYGYDNTTDSLMCLKYISLSKLFNVIDTDDKSYFRLLDLRWDNISYLNPTLVLSFNNKVDPVSGSQKKNYVFLIGKNEVKINNIQVVGENIFLRFKNDDVKGLTDSCEVYVQVLKDINGNILDKRKSIELYQYRELFVQEYNKPLPLKDSCYMEYLPLEKKCISTFTGKDKYWMNTPENININK